MKPKVIVSGIVEFTYHVILKGIETVKGNERCALHRAAMNARHTQVEAGKKVVKMEVNSTHPNDDAAI